MSSRRVLKAAECIRQVVSMSILVELKDPRIENVTVTFVEVSSDMRNAKVHVSIMGDETKQRLCLKGLQNSAGFLQQKINERIDTRYVPRIRFVLDQGVKHSIAVTKILDEVLPNEQTEQNDFHRLASELSDEFGGQPEENKEESLKFESETEISRDHN
jgi:ribosome-binding factor A